MTAASARRPASRWSTGRARPGARSSRASRSWRPSCASRCSPARMPAPHSTSFEIAASRSRRRPRPRSRRSHSASAPKGSSLVVRSPSFDLDSLTLADPPFIVVIEGVEKPGNLGAILRTADGAGVDALIAASPRTDLANPNVIRASAGTASRVPIAAASTTEVLDWLTTRGIRIVAARVDAELAYTDADLTGPLAIALGSEADGLTDAWRPPGVEAVRVADGGHRRQPQRVGHRGRAAVRGATATRRSRVRARLRRCNQDEPGTFDVVIIGAGPGGEAAAHKARELGASVAIVDRRWFGGSCPHIGCLPSKALLHGAAEHHANPARYEWPRASAHRDFMINRAADAAEPDDTQPRPFAREGGRRRVSRRGAHRRSRPHRCQPRGRPPRAGRRRRDRRRRIGDRGRSRSPASRRSASGPTSRRRSTRELPRSLLILGGGPTGCELAQVYARFGVPVTIVQSGPRLAPTDHPRNSDVVRKTLEADGVTVTTGVRAVAARAGAGRGWRARDRPR